MGSSDYMDSLKKLCLTEVLSLHLSSGVVYSRFLELTYNVFHVSLLEPYHKNPIPERH
jgi:hypothetical protein